MQADPPVSTNRRPEHLLIEHPTETFAAVRVWLVLLKTPLSCHVRLTCARVVQGGQRRRLRNRCRTILNSCRAETRGWHNIRDRGCMRRSSEVVRHAPSPVPRKGSRLRGWVHFSEYGGQRGWQRGSFPSVSSECCTLSHMRLRRPFNNNGMGMPKMVLRQYRCNHNSEDVGT